MQILKMLRCSLITRCFSCFNRDKNNYSKIEWKDTVPFVAPVTTGQVIKVYDGDTITIAAKLPYKSSPLYRFSVRLDGIDCPEIKGKNEDEKECAKLGRDILKEKILHKIVKLENVRTEKYGRILADVYYDNKHINNWLLINNLAVKYDGGTKTAPSSWMKYHKEVEFTDL
jgi:micrococcal nuclease